ncbi:MAG TPA: protein kinase [Phycisphaerae bacterium]|nr:protein kinase [Phycisphaerae bacterium]HRY71225.1 protein kinase [Phycisphaerae bacterium]HSA29580.1 protein kinase [Phycisphaerae bacterium]
MGCLTPEQVERLISEQLPADEADELRRHIASCEGCRAVFDECEANEQFLGRLRRHRDVVMLKPAATAEDATATVSVDWSGVQAALDDLPADTFTGYEIVRKISGGGQGVVYEAVQRATRRTVALKVLRGGALADERSRWRFEREVRLIAALKHPNIVIIHDSGVMSGLYYFAMDYVRGQPLDTHIRLTAPPIRQVIQLFKQVCEAIAYAHRRGVIHRDLKPSNILVGDDGTPCVLDFGLAKILNEELEESQRGLVSMPGVMLGTLAYMSPEQTRGEPEALDVRTDVYSLGVILYELLTGSRPYDTHGDLASVIQNIREVDPPRPSRLRREANSELDAIVLRAMAKEPQQRYGSAGELVEDLSAWLDGRPVSARSASSLYILRKLAVRHGFETAVICALVAALIGFGGISYRMLQNERERAGKLQGIVNANQRRTTEQAELASAVQLKVRQQAFDYFLAQFRSGKLEGARALQESLPVGSVERSAATFLTDEHYPFAKLLEGCGQSGLGLAWFVEGERALGAGRKREAVAAFERALALADKDEWLRHSVQKRLEPLRSASAPAGADATIGRR